MSLCLKKEFLSEVDRNFFTCKFEVVNVNDSTAVVNRQKTVSTIDKERYDSDSKAVILSNAVVVDGRVKSDSFSL
jgi:hypothetical protein